MNKPVLKILKLNSYWLFAGIFLLLLGYILLMHSPAGKSPSQLVFAWHKLTLAPIIVVAGYLALGVSIMVSTKK